MPRQLEGIPHYPCKKEDTKKNDELPATTKSSDSIGKSI